MSTSLAKGATLLATLEYGAGLSQTASGVYLTGEKKPTGANISRQSCQGGYITRHFGIRCRTIADSFWSLSHWWKTPTDTNISRQSYLESMP